MFVLPPLKRLCNGCEQVHHDEHNILKLTHKDDINKMGDFTAWVTWASLAGHPLPGLTGISKTESWLKWCAITLHLDLRNHLSFLEGNSQKKA